MFWLATADITLLLLSVILLWKQRQHLWRISVMLVGNLIVLRMINSVDFREDTMVIFLVETILLVLATALLLVMKFAPNAIRWREI